MQAAIIYNLISNVRLCHIHNIRNTDIFVSRHKIMTKCRTVINNASVKKLSSTTKRWMCKYKESIHLTHVCIKHHASLNNMTGKITYVNQMVLAIIFLFCGLPTRKQYNFEWIMFMMTTSLLSCLLDRLGRAMAGNDGRPFGWSRFISYGVVLLPYRLLCGNKIVHLWLLVVSPHSLTNIFSLFMPFFSWSCFQFYFCVLTLSWYFRHWRHRTW